MGKVDRPAAMSEEPEERQLTWGTKLAHNDKKVRDKTVKVLRLWLGKQADLTTLDMLKIWKGLFYCFWMSDKRPVQRELAQTLTALIGATHPNTQMRFVEAFFTTMVREWTGIDRLRLDKFYLLIETFLRGAFDVLVESGWEEDVLDEFVSLMAKGPLAPEGRAAKGLTTFLLDKWLPELRKASAEVPMEAFDKLLLPFYGILTYSPDKRIVKLTQSKIFEALLPQNMKEDETLIADINQVVLRLFELASGRDTTAVNRSVLYDLHGQFEVAIKQVMAMGELDEEEEEEEEVEEVEEVIPVAKSKKVKAKKRTAVEAGSKDKSAVKKKKKKTKA